MTDIKELGLFGNSGVLAYDTPFIDVSRFASFGIIAFNNSDFQYNLNWSSDGINTDILRVKDGMAGVAIHGYHLIKARYLKITYTTTLNPSNWRCQLLFRVAPEALTSLQNSGAGVELYKTEDRSIRTFKSTDGSLTFTQDTDDIDISVASVASTVWEESAGVISPISTVTNGKLCGDITTNILASSNTRCVIIGGEQNNFIVGNPGGSVNCGLIGGNNNTCQTVNGSSVIVNSLIVGGVLNKIQRGINSMVFGGASNELKSTSGFAPESICILGGESNTIDSGTFRTSIVGGQSNIISGASLPSVSNSSIIGGTNNNISSANGSSLINRASIVGGNNNFIERGEDNSILGGNNNIIASTSGGVSNRSTIISGRNNIIRGGASQSTVIGGENGTIDIGHENVWLFTHGSAFTSNGSNRFLIKNTSGTYIYSNDNATTGVQLMADSSSWASISDINMKENLVELNHHETMLKLDQIKVYRYNMIGSNPSYINIGPVAQDWHTHFGSPNIEVPIIGDDGKEIIDPYTGDFLTELKPAKNRLLIEDRDMIGVLMSCVKELYREIKILKSELSLLKK